MTSDVQEPQVFSGADGRAAPRVGRRRFVRLLLGWSALSTLALVAMPLIGFLIPGRSTRAAGGRQLAGRVTDFGLDEGTVMAIGSQPVVVLQGSDGFRAFSAVCTHLGCIVGYDTTQSPDIVCPCHDGHFSASTGSVISGPPPAPLQAFPVAIDGDQVFVQG